jgi:hypothetical protein
MPSNGRYQSGLGIVYYRQEFLGRMAGPGLICVGNGTVEPGGDVVPYLVEHFWQQFHLLDLPARHVIYERE